MLGVPTKGGVLISGVEGFHCTMTVFYTHSHEILLNVVQTAGHRLELHLLQRNFTRILPLNVITYNIIYFIIIHRTWRKQVKLIIYMLGYTI